MRLGPVILIAFALAGCRSAGNYAPVAQLTPQQWCAKAVMLMGSHYIAEQGREALLEMARNRGCFNAPPPSHGS